MMMMMMMMMTKFTAKSIAGGAELHAGQSFQTRPDPRNESRDPTRPVYLCGFLDPTKTRLMKSWNCDKRWCPPVTETCCETAQREPKITTIQRSIKTIMNVARVLHMIAFYAFRQQSH